MHGAFCKTNFRRIIYFSSVITTARCNSANTKLNIAIEKNAELKNTGNPEFNTNNPKAREMNASMKGIEG